jgi:hypothetical protein
MRPPARYIDRCAPPRTATARIRFGGGAGQCPGRLLRRTTVGRAPAQANRNGPGPYGLGTCVRQGPAARSSAVQNLGPLSIKFRLLAASLFIKPSGPSVKLQSSHRGHIQNSRGTWKAREIEPRSQIRGGGEFGSDCIVVIIGVPVKTGCGP